MYDIGLYIKIDLKSGGKERIQKKYINPEEP